MLNKVVWALSSVVCLSSAAEDWVEYRHDYLRSGKSSEQLAVSSLKNDWVYDNLYKPEPAWYGPAKRDSYIRLEGLRSMRDYDTCLHTISVGSNIYFSSTVDHSVYCLEKTTGQVKWRFTTDAPVRVVPTWYNDRVYFGSDDGYVYCLEADSGKLVWRYAPNDEFDLTIAYGNLTSLFPCRTGITVVDGKIFCGFSMLPWEKTFLCSLDAETGKELYSESYSDLTMEAPFAYTAGRLIAPQGRISPVIFSSKTGKKLGALTKGGGSFVLVTDDNRVIHGPGNKRGWLNDSSIDQPAQIVSTQGANAMVVHGGVAFVLSDTELSAIERKTNKKRWTKQIECNLSLILAGQTVFLGGFEKVSAYDSVTGTKVWSADVEGRAKGLTVANGQLLVSTDTGKIYSFKSVDGFSWSEKASTVRKPNEAKGNFLPKAGPFVDFQDGEAVVSWITKSNTPCELLVYDGDKVSSFKTSSSTKHQVRVKKLKHNFIHHYQLIVSGKKSAKFELDTFFNFSINSPKKLPKGKSFKHVAKSLANSGVPRTGLALVIGIERGDLAKSLLSYGFTKVICLETDVVKVKKLRSKLFEENLYGRIVVKQVDRYGSHKLPGGIANIIVSENEFSIGNFPVPFTTLHRYLKTGEGVIVSLNTKTDLQNYVPSLFRTQIKGRAIKAVSLKDSAEWRHQYGNPDNAGFAGEGLGGVSKASDLKVQWISRPGPRFQADRNGRKTSPLVAGGRLFVQGLERIIAVDRANGSVLWSKEMPGFMRFNVPRDSSNWCTDGEYIYAANRDHCLKISCETGAIASVIPLIGKQNDDEWSYIANYGRYLIGSSTKAGTQHKNFFGAAGEGWYDASSGAVTDKIASDTIFVRSKSGKKLWSYEKGLIINSTITVKYGRLYFVENLSKSLKSGKTRRIPYSEELTSKLSLVCLDIKSGKCIWNRKVSPTNIQVMLQLVAAENSVIMQESGGNRYYLQAFSAKNGRPMWQNDGSWKASHHGAHMSRPVVVGNKLYLRPHVFDVATGYRLENMKQPDGGCGTYAATAHSLIYRHGTVTMWGMEDNTITKWSRLRPGCWLSTIPAEGMILSPEAGGGCSCGNWLETSIGFVPTKRSELIFSSADKEFVDSMTIELINLSGVGKVHYTVDGSEPTKISPVYSKAINIAQDLTIKAKVITSDGKDYATIERKFIKLYPAPVFGESSDIVLEGKKIRVTAMNSFGDKNAVIRYTKDGSAPTEQSRVFKSHIIIDSGCKISLRSFYKDGGKSPVVSREFKVLKMMEPTVAKTSAGIGFKAFNKKFNKIPDFQKLNADKSGVIKNFDIAASGYGNNFAMIFEGYVKISGNGIYDFGLSSDDGSKLWIGDQLVVDNDGLHGAGAPVVGQVALKAGLHKIKVGYFDAGGGKSLKVFFAASGKKLHELNASLLSH